MTFDDVFLLVNEAYGIPHKAGWHKLSPDTIVYFRGMVRIISTSTYCFWGLVDLPNTVHQIVSAESEIKTAFVRDCLTKPDISLTYNKCVSQMSFDLSEKHQSIIKNINKILEN